MPLYTKYNQHPIHTYFHWKAEIQDDKTEAGYHAWVMYKLAENLNSNEQEY